jgi:hypothetical protein
MYSRFWVRGHGRKRSKLVFLVFEVTVHLVICTGRTAFLVV